MTLCPWFEAPELFAEEVAYRLPERLVERRLDLADVAEPGNARLIVGPRRAGKSTLVWRFLADREPTSVMFLSAEEALVRSW